MSKIEGNKAARIEIQQQQMQGNGKVQEQEQTISAFGDGYQTEETGGDGFSRTSTEEVDEQAETQEAPKDDGKLLARDENGKLTGKINWENAQTDKTPDELVHENAERIRNAEHFEEEVSLNDDEEAARTAAKEQAAKVADEQGMGEDQKDSYVRMMGNSAVLKERVHQNGERIRNAEHFEETEALNDGEEAARTAAKEQAAKVAEEQGMSADQADSYIRMMGNNAVLNERIHQNVTNAEANGAGSTTMNEAGTTEASSDETNIDANADTEGGKVTGQQQQQTVIVDGKVVAQQQMQDGKPVEAKDVNVNVDGKDVKTDKAEGKTKADKAETPEKTDKTEKADKAEKTEKADKSGNAGETAKSDKTDANSNNVYAGQSTAKVLENLLALANSNDPDKGDKMLNNISNLPAKQRKEVIKHLGRIQSNAYVSNNSEYKISYMNRNYTAATDFIDMERDNNKVKIAEIKSQEPDKTNVEEHKKWEVKKDMYESYESALRDQKESFTGKKRGLGYVLKSLVSIGDPIAKISNPYGPGYYSVNATSAGLNLFGTLFG